MGEEEEEVKDRKKGKEKVKEDIYDVRRWKRRTKKDDDDIVTNGREGGTN